MEKYIWYSGATDITGKVLEESLHLTGIKTRPRTVHQGDIIIGWGAKTRENVDLSRATVLNHPDKIRLNRDKLKSLETMSANRNLAANIATFCASGRVSQELANGHLVLPLVGRTKFHQGGKGFWLCLTKQHVDKAIADGAQYFQTYVDIKDEYRLHVAFGRVIYAVKKIENPTETGWITQRKQVINDYAVKNNVTLDGPTIDYVLKRLVKEASLPDRIVRSNKRGWKFSNVRLSNLGSPLKNAAIKSVEVSGLDFGAVDCAISADNTAFIIEINSGPGLQGTALQKYVEAFTAKLAELERPAPVRRNPVRAAVNAVGRAVGAASAERTAPAALPATNVDDAAMVHMMNAVQSPEEARMVLDLMRSRQ